MPSSLSDLGNLDFWRANASPTTDRLLIENASGIFGNPRAFFCGCAESGRRAAAFGATFRRENKALFTESFVKVLELAKGLKLAQFGQITVSADGTKIAANASKHSAVSYEHAGKTIEQLELEVQQLLVKAEQADATPLQDGLSIPAEIVRRQERKAALEKARAEIEVRAHARYAAALGEYEKKMAARQARIEPGGQRQGGVGGDRRH